MPLVAGSVVPWSLSAGAVLTHATIPSGGVAVLAFLWFVFLALLALAIHSVVVHRGAPLSVSSAAALGKPIVPHRRQSV